jgi:hypothetical protein
MQASWSSPPRDTWATPVEHLASSSIAPPSSGSFRPNAGPPARGSRTSSGGTSPGFSAALSCRGGLRRRWSSASKGAHSARPGGELGTELVCAAKADVKEDEEARQDPRHERRALGDPDRQHPDDDVGPQDDAPNEGREPGTESWHAEVHRAVNSSLTG